MKEFSATRYLAQKLAMFGIEGLPPGTLGDLADHAVTLAKALRVRSGEREAGNIMRMLDGQAAVVSALLTDSRDAAGRPVVQGEMRDEIAAILEKHGVDIPPGTFVDGGK